MARMIFDEYFGEWMYFNYESGGVVTGFGTLRLFNSETASNVDIYFDAANGHVDNWGSNVNIYDNYGNNYIDNFYGNNVKIYAYKGSGYPGIWNQRGKNVEINALGDSPYCIYNTGDYVQITTGAGDDTINNYDGTHVEIQSGFGDDWIYNDSSKVTIDAGDDEGCDTVDNRSTSVKIFTKAGRDSITNSGSKVTIDAGAGNDSIYNEGSKVSIDGGAGNDSIYNEGDKVTISAGKGKDTIENYGSNVSINTTADSKADSISNYGSTVTILSGAGNDKIYNEGDKVTISAGNGKDTIENRGSNVSINTTADSKADSISNYGSAVTLLSGASNDYIYNESSNVTISSGAGNDTIINKGKNVSINGGNDNDLLINGRDDDENVQDDLSEKKANDISTNILRAFLEACRSDEDFKSILVEGKNSPALAEYKEDVAEQIADIFRKTKEISEEALNFHDDATAESKDKFVEKILLPGCTQINNIIDFLENSNDVAKVLKNINSLGKIGRINPLGPTYFISLALSALSMSISKAKYDSAWKEYSEFTGTQTRLDRFRKSAAYKKLEKAEDEYALSVIDLANTALSPLEAIGGAVVGAVGGGLIGELIGGQAGGVAGVIVGGAGGYLAAPTLINAFMKTLYLMDRHPDTQKFGPTFKTQIKNTLGLDLFDNLKGSSGDNPPQSISTDGQSTTLLGAQGNDTIINGADYVYIDAGEDKDEIVNSGHHVIIEAQGAGDKIYNFGHLNSIDAGSGNDTIYNLGYFATISGSDGEDYIENYNEEVSISGGNQNDTIDNYSSRVTINGDGGNDTIYLSIYGRENVIEYVEGDGDDVVWNFGETDTLKISGWTYTKEVKGSDVIFRVNKGSITLKNCVLKNINVDGTRGEDWTFSGSTAKYGTSDKTLIKVTGVKSLDGISLNDKVVTVSEKSLNKDKVTISKGYTLKLDNDVPTSTTKETGSFTKFKSGTATYKTSSFSDYYSLKNNKITYTPSAGGKTVSIKNLNSSTPLKTIKSGITVTEQKNGSLKITFKNADVLTTKNPVVTAAGLTYTVAVVKSLKPAALTPDWNVSGTNASLKSDTGAGYSVVNNKIVYNKKVTGSPQIVLSGLVKNASLSAPVKKLVTLDSKVLGKNSSLQSNDGSYTVKLTGNMSKKTFTASDKADTLNVAASNAAVLGGAGNDKFTVSGSKVTLTGGKGDDTISALGSKNLLVKYASDDGNDLIQGFNATSTLSISGSYYSTQKSDSDIIVSVGEGKITLNGAANLSELNITGNKGLTVTNSTKSPVTVAADVKVIDASKRTKAIKITGNKLANTILGGSKADSLYGGKGNDSLVGNAGNDKLYGQAGNDIIYGGKGNDSLWGGAGNDTLYGGAGNDTFIYKPGEGTDRIMDYSSGDMLKILKTNGKDGGTFSTATFKKNTLTLAISGGGSVIFNGVAAGDKVNINSKSYTISGNTLK